MAATKTVVYHFASMAAGAWGMAVFAQSGSVDLYKLIAQLKTTWGDLVVLSSMLAPILAAGAAAYRTYSMKQVPSDAVAIAPHDDGSKVGTPSAAQKIVGNDIVVAGKVVGALLFALILFGAAPSAFAQQRALSILGNNAVVQFFSNWTADDVNAAQQLATDFKDDVGAKCWATFGTMGAVIKAHPLPVTFKLASDIQAARLFAKAVKQVCLEPACSQMWNDLQNQIGAFTPIPMPISLASICAKIP